MCSSISIFADNTTEFEEDFTVALGLVTAGDSLRLGNNVTTVTHIDDDGKTQPLCIGSIENNSCPL